MVILYCLLKNQVLSESFIPHAEKNRDALSVGKHGLYESFVK
jgi:hypothetical protein